MKDVWCPFLPLHYGYLANCRQKEQVCQDDQGRGHLNTRTGQLCPYVYHFNQLPMQ